MTEITDRDREMAVRLGDWGFSDTGQRKGCLLEAARYIAQAREEALERAAEVCEEYDEGDHDYPGSVHVDEALAKVAARIRAMMKETER